MRILKGLSLAVMAVGMITMASCTHVETGPSSEVPYGVVPVIPPVYL